MARLDPTISTLKSLFALSCNVCAVPQCEQRLADPAWQSVMAEVAHIHGANPGSARYDPAMTDEERRAPDNLILVCPTHHKLIDLVDADQYTGDTLRDWKRRHESRCAGNWAEDSLLEHYSILLRQEWAESMVARARLVLEQGSGDSFEIVNIGDGDASNISVEPIDENTAGELAPMSIPPASLAPGGRWKAGYYAPSLASSGTHIVRVSWTDADGTPHSGEFPLS